MNRTFHNTEQRTKVPNYAQAAKTQQQQQQQQQTRGHPPQQSDSEKPQYNNTFNKSGSTSQQSYRNS